MKRLMTLILCFTLICSVVPCVYAENTTASAPSNKIKTLMDLELLDKYEPNADVTRGTLKNAVDALYGTKSYLNYLEDRDMNQPVLYGQVLMVLVDLTGWAPLIEYNGYDKNNPAGYYRLAVRAEITSKKTGEFNAPIKAEDYAELLYSTVCDASLLKATYYSNGTSKYTVDKSARLLDSVLNLYYIEGVLTGVGKMSLDGRTSGDNTTETAVAGKWFKTADTVESKSCFGMKVRVFIDKNDQIIKSILPLDNDNKVVKIKSDDIVKSATSSGMVTYTAQNDKKKSIAIDKEADYIYNGRLYELFKADDLKLEDCTYKFIDNNNDSKYDVILVDKYETFMVDTVLTTDEIIVDKNNKMYDLEDYLKDGGEIRKADGRLLELGDIGKETIVSYAASRDGEYTGFIVSDKKMSGLISRVEENWKNIYVSGKEYESLNSYYANRSKFEKVDVGDEAELYFDFEGYIAEIKKISRTVKAGYIFSATEQAFGNIKFKILSETGKFEDAITASSVRINDKRVDEAQLRESKELFDENGFIPQLVLYKLSGDGELYSIETAKNMQGSGNVDNDGFTLDYDATGRDDYMRAFSINGKKVLNAKYVLSSEAKLFMINSSDKNESYVLPASSISTGTSVKGKLYNVNKDYEPEYILMTDGGDGIGSWVDKWSKSYVADQIIEEYDAETGEARSKLVYYDGAGKQYSTYIQDDTVHPIWGNAMYPTVADNPRSAEISAARSSRFVPISLKNIKRGTVFQFNSNSKGITSFAIQHMPEDDNHEIIFEGTNGVVGSNYGTTKTIFNGSSLEP